MSIGDVNNSSLTQVNPIVPLRYDDLFEEIKTKIVGYVLKADPFSKVNAVSSEHRRYTFEYFKSNLNEMINLIKAFNENNSVIKSGAEVVDLLKLIKRVRLTLIKDENLRIKLMELEIKSIDLTSFNFSENDLNFLLNNYSDVKGYVLKNRPPFLKGLEGFIWHCYENDIVYPSIKEIAIFDAVAVDYLMIKTVFPNLTLCRVDSETGFIIHNSKIEKNFEFIVGPRFKHIAYA